MTDTTPWAPPTGVAAPAGAAANTAARTGSVALPPPPAGPPAPPDGYGPYGYLPPQPQPPRRGPLIAIVTAIVLAGALIAAAILFRGGDDATQTQAPPADTAASAPAQPSAAPPAPEALSTCDAWAVAATKIDAYPRFPAGWTYQTAGIEEFIAGRNAAFTEILNTFETQIQAQPANVKILSETVLERYRSLLAKLGDGTYINGDEDPMLASVNALGRACGLG